QHRVTVSGDGLVPYQETVLVSADRPCYLRPALQAAYQQPPAAAAPNRQPSENQEQAPTPPPSSNQYANRCKHDDSKPGWAQTQKDSKWPQQPSDYSSKPSDSKWPQQPSDYSSKQQPNCNQQTSKNSGPYNSTWNSGWGHSQYPGQNRQPYPTKTQ